MFNKNESEGVTRNVRLLHSAVDEIVVIDSSDPDKYNELENSLKSFDVKLYRALPLGHLEPYLHYGISKTSSEYILKLDSDEEPSKEFIKLIKQRKFSNNCAVYWVDEENHSLGYKTVLFSRDSIKEIIGRVHNGIEFNVAAKNLPKNIKIIHHKKNGNTRVYLEIESYERPIQVYLKFLKQRKKYLGMVPSIFYSFPKPFNKILTAISLGFGGKILFFDSGVNGLSWSIYEYQKINFFESLPIHERLLRTKIAKEMIDCGVIKYLGLDKPAIVESLTKTFKWDLSGLEVFRKLLIYRYKNKKPARIFPY
jgi:hypothetical protein